MSPIHPAHCAHLARLCKALLLIPGALALCACQSAAPAAHAPALDDAPPALAGARASALALPPGLEPQQVAPRTGKALARARRPLEKVLAGLDTPSFLAQGPEPPKRAADTEPPIKAQRAYAAARQALFHGRFAQAADQLETARRLAPRRPDLLSLLGRVRLATGDRGQGVAHLERAARLDPARLGTLFLLARDAMNRQRWPRAAAILASLLHRAAAGGDDARWSDPALVPLAHYQLAVALRHLSADGAAADQYRAFFAASRQAQPIASRYGRELMLLEHARGQNHRVLGDLQQRLGRPAKARRAYAAALEAGVSDRPALIKRLVYADLLLGRSEDARRRVTAQVRGHAADPDTLALVSYLGKHTPKPGPLAAALRAAYQRQGQGPAGLAIALSDLLPPARGRDLLEAHLRAYPRDQRVYEHLLKKLRSSPPPSAGGQVTTGPADPASLGEAIVVTASLMRAAPSRADRYAVTLLRRATAWSQARHQPPRTQAEGEGEGEEGEGGESGESGEGGGVLAPGFAALKPAQTRSPNARVLAAMSLALAGQTDEAASRLDRVIEANPGLVVARVQRVKLALGAAKTRLAAKLLEPLKDSTDLSVVALRARMLSESGRPDKALGLLSKRIDAEDDPEAVTTLMKLKARLQVAMNRFKQAKRTVRDALKAYPDQPSLYALLFKVYDRAGDTPAIQYRALTRRMLTNVPHSRLARFKLAQFHAARQEYAQARALLSRLVDKDPLDYAAVALLARVQAAAGHPEKADALLSRELDAAPRDPKMILLARRYYAHRGDKRLVMGLTEQLLKLQPRGFNRAKGLALVYYNTDRPRQAAATAARALSQMDRGLVKDPGVLAAVMWHAMLETGQGRQARQRLRAAIRRFPRHANDLEYQLAALIDRQGDARKAAGVLERILARDPSNASASNGLAYNYAMRGVHLKRALKRIDQALHAHPSIPAFQDTKGWVLYKMGRFQDAAKWLHKGLTLLNKNGPASNPRVRAVLQNHLAAALYREGDPKAAAAAWRVIVDLDDRHLLPEKDPEVAGLPDRARARLQAIKRGGKPKLP